MNEKKPRILLGEDQVFAHQIAQFIIANPPLFITDDKGRIKEIRVTIVKAPVNEEDEDQSTKSLIEAIVAELGRPLSSLRMAIKKIAAEIF